MKKIIQSIIVLLVAGSAFAYESIAVYTTDDSMVGGGSGADSNLGTLNQMYIRHANDTWGDVYSLATFDVSSIPVGSTIISVRMRFYTELLAWPTTPTNFCPVGVFENTEDWDESTVTYNTAPAHEAAAAQSAVNFLNGPVFTGTNTISTGTAGWLQFFGAGMTDMVQGWVNSPQSNFGVTISGMGDYLSDSRGFNLKTKEHPTTAVRPYIYIEYTLPENYASWAGGWGVDIGAETNDYDGDGLSNLAEFGLDGDPTNALSRGVSPEFNITDSGAVYVYPQRASSGSGLSYHIETCSDLIGGVWSNAGYSVVGTNVTGETLNYVTNTTDAVADQKFIRLIIE